ncbi:TOTE conflict system archaeo-eukaryotic primase domain-containing protein [Haloferula sp. A504]|uniref:TOTE conflict system archaeo-eukaryotic primase domain-containing protein n=1 Tax=Haloferula sp. A504 TaxID=3373601 RepID=UPI0031C7975D|nr:DEAD/DEAH box helicase family protein [Verrucomicrobiaceae bacterium E54]
MRNAGYPRRFESRRTGRAGYAPACGNEWVRGVCEKPRIKCADCAHRAFLPVTDEMIHWHLSGRDKTGADFVAGVYPMLADETCRFLAIDFDKEAWGDDVRAVMATCANLEIPAALERSRSGNGGHVWLFFAEAVPATLARKLGSFLLTETMERRPELGLASYDRLFPNQDTLPKGGFGNLIALPLQKEPRMNGNSVFVDDALTPWPDQWAFLSGIQRIEKERVKTLARDADSRGRVTGVRFVSADDGEDDEPWNAPPSRRRREPPIGPPLPAELELVLGDQIYLAKNELPAALRNRLVRLAAFQNPEFYRAQAMRLPTYGKPRIISCAEDLPEHIGLPRGCIDELKTLLRAHKIKRRIRDERVTGEPLEVKFTGTLRPEQEAAAKAMLAHDTGVLAATTAFGKTVLAAHLIAARGVNTLVLVHRQQLMEQWVERLSAFLDIPVKSIGRLGGGRRKLTGGLDVALIQSVVRKGVVDDRVADYGHLIVDECHHLSAQSFELVARRAKARFVCGLSATITRKDGHHPIIFMQCGPVRHRVDAKRQAEARPFSHHVIVRPTGFRSMVEPDPDRRLEYQNLCDELMRCVPRNEMIRDEVLAALREGRSPLVLTERTEHIEILDGLLRPHVEHLVVLRGGMGRKVLREAMESLTTIPEDEGRVVIATGRFVGEGFDDPRLDTLFLTMPVSWRGTVAQYAGRLHRLHDGKREVRIHDYADLDVPMLSRMFDKRCAGYEAVGYTILLPASALPGWPAEVPLPIDPLWKRDYAASVRRLIRDGVDVPLAGLFVAASRPTDDESRARSASEAFLFRRLGSLPETAGLFWLNQKLPIPFDGWSEMEVDLFSHDLKIAIEIDGPQHLADPEAYRRDRRKDALLQENGCHVLRFLAEDLAKHLDATLDAIHRAVAHRRRFRQ